MNPAPKKYYTVKEAARLLGVSTNTLYKYLDEGRLQARRIGQGRFKVPYSQLAPFIDSSISQTQGVETPLTQPTPTTVYPQTLEAQPALPPLESSLSARQPQTSDSETLTISQELDTPGQVYPMVNDKFFWRLLKGLSLLGLGIIYSFTANFVFDFSGSFFEESSEILNLILPFGLILTGVLSLLDVFLEEKVRYYDTLIHIISASVTIYFSFVSMVTGEFGRFVFASPLAILTVSHLVDGTQRHKGTFFGAFTKYVSLLSVIGGVMVMLYPSLFPVTAFSGLIKSHPGVFAVLWFGLLTSPMLYLLSSYGKNSRVFAPLFLLLTGIMVLIFATELAIQAKWDLSYLSYLLAIFGLFLAWWKISSIVISRERINSASLPFVWVSVATLIGFFIVSNAQKEFRVQKERIVLTSLDQSTQKVRNKVDEASSVLTGFAGSSDLVGVIDEKDKEKAINKAKEIYERTDLAKRALVFDSEGYVLGVYPRESITQGANLSSREYFQRTKNTYKGVTSDLLLSVIGTYAIIVTQPVFKDNTFFGMVAVAIDLEKLSSLMQAEVGKDNVVSVFDSKGVYIFGTNTKDIGKKKEELSYLLGVRSTNGGYKLYQDEFVSLPWKFVLQVPNESLASETSYINILLSILIVVNSAFSIFAGIAIATRKKNNGSSLSLTSQLMNPPGISLGGA